MRFLVHHWYIVPLAALFALYLCTLAALNTASERIQTLTTPKVALIYRLASKGDYHGLMETGLVTKEVADYLRMQTECFGPVESWTADSFSADTFSMSWQTTIL